MLAAEKRSCKKILKTFGLQVHTPHLKPNKHNSRAVMQTTSLWFLHSVVNTCPFHSSGKSSRSEWAEPLHRFPGHLSNSAHLPITGAPELPLGSCRPAVISVSPLLSFVDIKTWRLWKILFTWLKQMLPYWQLPSVWIFLCKRKNIVFIYLHGIFLGCPPNLTTKIQV